MDDEEKEVKSKSQIKREHDELRSVVREVVELPAAIRRQLDLPSSIEEPVDEAASMSRAALQRQIRFITGLISDEDADISETELRRRLLVLKRPRKQSNEYFHLLESWRDRLLREGDEALTELATHYPAVDRQQIRQLVRNARDERRHERAPRAARRLFQTLKELIPKGDESSSTNH